MKGILKMLSGRGEREYRLQHRRFHDAIPDNYPADMTVAERAERHPAYSGPMANSLDADNYRRALNLFSPPKSKAEHAALTEYQRTHDQYGRRIAEVEDAPERRGVLEWLVETLLP